MAARTCAARASARVTSNTGFGAGLVAAFGYLGLLRDDVERALRHIDLFAQRADRRVGARGIGRDDDLHAVAGAATASDWALAASIERCTRPNRSTSYAASMMSSNSQVFTGAWPPSSRISSVVASRP